MRRGITRTAWRMLALVTVVLGGAELSAEETLAPEKVLDLLAGEWRIESTILPTEFVPDEKQVTGTASTRRVLGGAFVQEDATGSDGNDGMTLFSYNELTGGYRCWYFSSRGITAEAEGKWDAEARTLTWTTVGDLPVTATTVQKFVDADHTEFRIEVVDTQGEVVFRLEGKRERVK